MTPTFMNESIDVSVLCTLKEAVMVMIDILDQGRNVRWESVERLSACSWDVILQDYILVVSIEHREAGWSN